MKYVYILKNERNPPRRYIGLTGDLRARLLRHNAGEVCSTARHRPWHIDVYIAFSDNRRALAFERYLKSGKGHAFARKRF
jgi:predicted GIY-YIG superfamily endonuclease